MAGKQHRVRGGRCRDGDETVGIRLRVLPPGEQFDPHVRGVAVDRAQAARRVELRGGTGHRRAAAAADPAVPAEGSRGEPGVGAAGVDRRHRVRHHLSRPALGAALTGQRCPAARPDRPDRLPADGQVPAVVGDVHRRRPGPQPHRHLHEIASGARQRHVGAGDRARHRRPDPEATGVRRGHLDPGPRTQRFPAVRRRAGGVGHPAHCAGRRGPLGGGRPGHHCRCAGGRRPSHRRRRTHSGPRHRAEQPAEHHRLAQPAVHGGRAPARGVPRAAGALRM